MKERPIIFSAPMVRALLEGRKTQTRRVLKEQPKFGFPVRYDGPDFDNAQLHWWEELNPDGETCTEEYHELGKCPYGVPGDRLWVRENFDVCLLPNYDDGHYCLGYTADGKDIEIDGSEIREGRLKPGKRYSCIHMPRWASRLTLEITGVRVERVQNISEADAIAEGIEGRWHPNASDIWTWRDYARAERFAYGAMWGPRESYRTLWESLHGKDPAHAWAANPWVWCLSFKRVEEQAR